MTINDRCQSVGLRFQGVRRGPAPCAAPRIVHGDWAAWAESGCVGIGGCEGRSYAHCQGNEQR